MESRRVFERKTTEFRSDTISVSCAVSGIQLSDPNPPVALTHGQFHMTMRGHEDWFLTTHRTWFGKKLRLFVLAKTKSSDFEPHLIEARPSRSRDSKLSIAYRAIMLRDEISRAIAENNNRVVVFR